MTSYVVSVEDEMGTQYVVGPFDTVVVAEIVAARHRRIQRWSSYVQEKGHEPVDEDAMEDQIVFAWVVPFNDPAAPVPSIYGRLPEEASR